MTLSQKILINIVLFGVNTLGLLEKKLLDLINGAFLLSFNLAVFFFVYLNISYVQYLFGGLLYASVYPHVHNISIDIPSNKNNVLGYSTASLIRTLPSPEISAQVALVVDKNTDKVLFSLNGDRELASASTTKLMTALVVLDLYNLNDVLEVPTFCATVEGSKVGLSVGDFFTVDTLLHALLIQSGADAACALSNGKVSYIDFVDSMNAKALSLGMDNTSFTNPIGLDGVNGSHYSTANDLYTLAKEATSNEIISSIVRTKDYLVSSMDKKVNIKINNTNKLLWEIPNSVGVKTGTTAAAGEVFIYEYLEKDENIDLVIIVMNSIDRFYDTKSLLNWTLGSYSWDVK